MKTCPHCGDELTGKQRKHCGTPSCKSKAYRARRSKAKTERALRLNREREQLRRDVRPRLRESLRTAVERVGKRMPG